MYEILRALTILQTFNKHKVVIALDWEPEGESRPVAGQVTGQATGQASYSGATFGFV